jgi:hypothetical protein
MLLTTESQHISHKLITIMDIKWSKNTWMLFKKLKQKEDISTKRLKKQNTQSAVTNIFNHTLQWMENEKKYDLY